MKKKKAEDQDQELVWPEPSPEGESGDPRDPRSSLVSEILKKLATAGVTAAFLTEETIRGFLSDLKLPKETINLIIQGASKSKNDLVNKVGRELTAMVSKIDLVKEFSRFMEGHKFKVQMEIEVVPKSSEKDHS